jgi:hypothetical protein
VSKSSKGVPSNCDVNRYVISIHIVKHKAVLYRLPTPGVLDSVYCKVYEKVVLKRHY